MSNQIQSTVTAGNTSAEIQESALSILSKNGLPNRRVEAWHYTDLRNKLKVIPEVSTRTDDALALAALKVVKPLVDSVSFGFMNGYFYGLVTGQIPSGVSCDSCEGAVKALYPVEDFNTVGLLAQAHSKSGVCVEISANTQLEQPLGFFYAQEGENVNLASSRSSVNIGKNVTATLIEQFSGQENVAYVSNSVCDLTVGAGSKVFWIIYQCEGRSASHLGQLNVKLLENAQLDIFVLNSGSQLTRREINVEVEGENSEIHIRAINLLGSERHIDVTTVLNHKVPNTIATETIRNVVFDKASGVFQGQIRVAQIAQKTDAKMACNTLLMSDEADFSIKPELEIFADDVLCGHGATVIDLDKTQLFYLMARGISEKSARALLVNAFIAEIVEELENENLVEALDSHIRAWLKRHV